MLCPTWELIFKKDVFEQSLTEDQAARSRRAMTSPSWMRGQSELPVLDLHGSEGMRLLFASSK